MSDYFLKVISLENCPYSNAALELIKNNRIQNNTTIISHSDKLKYKTNKIDTFPQIYLSKYNKKETLLLGGYDSLSSFIAMFKGIPLSEQNINNFMNNNNTWSKKAVLRLIQLINQK
jgi:hypothetical protein